jgi:hypothetical protein
VFFWLPDRFDGATPGLGITFCAPEAPVWPVNVALEFAALDDDNEAHASNGDRVDFGAPAVVEHQEGTIREVIDLAAAEL